jgi:penicillin-binding protein 1A
MTKETKKNSSKAKWIISLLFWLFIITPALTVFTLLKLAEADGLPTFEELENPQSMLATEVLSADGEVLGKYYRENRTNVTFNELSPYLVNALVATEDERFYSHSGIDFKALGRVAAGVVTQNQSSGGGSTITQQLGKNLFPREKLTKWGLVKRKFKEWIIATRLEKQFTKEEIITMYLNTFDWIKSAVGIKSASYIYFSSTPDSLKIEQAAMLVGMAKNPSLYNPINFPENAIKRRMVVLKQMEKQGYITTQEYDSLKVLPLGIAYNRVSHDEGKAPYFREVIRLDLDKLFKEKLPNGKFKYAKADGSPYNIYRDGLKIYTTIDSRLQEYAENAVESHLGGYLQQLLEKDLSKWRYPPFSNDLSKEQIDGIINRAVKRTDRYWYLTNRPNKKPMPQDSINIVFDTPVPMTIFSWKGEIDTLMSPRDSIWYYKKFLRASVFSMDPKTGFVKAWVGGPNYKHFKYDMVRQGKRQVGSTFKPMVFATAVREGTPPCYQVPKVPVTFKKGTFNLLNDYTPQDSDRDYGYNVSLKWGLANSVNTITAWIMKKYGPEAVIKLARDLGIKSELEPVVSLGYGVADLSLMEIVAANSTFANKGVYIEPIYITRIEDKNGAIIFEVIPESREAIDEETAYIMLNMMQGTIDGVLNHNSGKRTGTAMRLRMDLPDRQYDGFKRDIAIAGKTGTTQNQSDGWFMGLTPDLVTGVWVGAEDRSVRFRTLQSGMGTNTALPIWGFYMKDAFNNESLNLSKGPFEKPEGFNINLDCDKQITNSLNKGGSQEINW